MSQPNGNDTPNNRPAAKQTLYWLAFALFAAVLLLRWVVRLQQPSPEEKARALAQQGEFARQFLEKQKRHSPLDRDSQRALERAKHLTEEAAHLTGEARNVRPAAETFLDLLQAGRVEEAYSATSSRFKAQFSLDQLSSFLDEQPALKQARRYVGLEITVQSPGTEPTYQFRYTAEAGGKEIDFTVAVIADNGAGRVDQLAVKGN